MSLKETIKLTLCLISTTTFFDFFSPIMATDGYHDDDYDYALSTRNANGIIPFAPLPQNYNEQHTAGIKSVVQSIGNNPRTERVVIKSSLPEYTVTDRVFYSDDTSHIRSGAGGKGEGGGYGIRVGADGYSYNDNASGDNVVRAEREVKLVPSTVESIEIKYYPKPKTCCSIL